MIKGHNPNRTQKKLLSSNGYEWTEYLVIKVYPDKVEFRHKTTEKSLILSYE